MIHARTPTTDERSIMARSIRLAAAVAAALSIGLIAGCGGSSTEAASSTSADSAMTKEQYVTQVNALCAVSSARSKAAKAPTDAASIDGFLAEQENIGKDISEAVAALPAPADISASVQTMLDGWKSQLALIAAARDKIASGGDPMAALQEIITEAKPISVSVDAAATEAGLVKCVD